MIDVSLTRGIAPAYSYTRWTRTVQGVHTWEYLIEFGMFQLWISRSTGEKTHEQTDGCAEGARPAGGDVP